MVCDIGVYYGVFFKILIDSADIERAVIVVVFILYAILYVKRMIANIRDLQPELKMILTEN